VDTDNLIAELAHLIAADFIKKPGRAIGDDEPLLTSGLVDSLHLMDLALHVERQYGVALDDTELNPQTFNTLNELAALIRARQS
jgi:acyl carrier protein